MKYIFEFNCKKKTKCKCLSLGQILNIYFIRICFSFIILISNNAEDLLVIGDMLEQNIFGYPGLSLFGRQYPPISDNIEVFLHSISISTAKSFTH